MRGGEVASLLARIAQGEGLQLDFKQRIDSARKIARTLAAFANTQGGSLLIGVKDNGRILGIDPEQEYHMIDLAARRYVMPPVSFEARTYEIDGKALLEIYVPPRPAERPFYALEEDDKPRAYVRVADQTRLAGGFLEEFWRAEKKPQRIYFRQEEHILLEYLRTHPTINETTYQALLGRRRAWKARKILIKYLIAGTLQMEVTPGGEVFRLSA